MKKNNYLVLGASAIVAALLLALWYYLGFNKIDNPLDLGLSIVWWALIALIVVAIVRLERNRQRAIRTIYVSPTALYNSERGVVGLGNTSSVDAMQEILASLKYSFDKKALPEQGKFDYRFVVKTDEFKAAASGEGEQATWKGSVVKLDHENGNIETKFEDMQQLREALAA